MQTALPWILTLPKLLTFPLHSTNHHVSKVKIEEGEKKRKEKHIPATQVPAQLHVAVRLDPAPHDELAATDKRDGRHRLDRPVHLDRPAQLDRVVRRDALFLLHLGSAAAAAAALRLGG